ncbi:hypothetical protein ACVPPR_00395 [Dellaglioa sp. L3N]
MKKNLFLIAALVLGSTAVVSSSVSADDEKPASNVGTATLDITPGTFSQTGAPSFKFSSALTENLIKGNADLKAIGKDDQSFTVSDYLGTDG